MWALMLFERVITITTGISFMLSKGNVYQELVHRLSIFVAQCKRI